MKISSDILEPCENPFLLYFQGQKSEENLLKQHCIWIVVIALLFDYLNVGTIEQFGFDSQMYRSHSRSNMSAIGL
jgi:hypothetical protein